MLATLQPFLGWLVKSDWLAGYTLICLMLARNLIVSLGAPHSYGLVSSGRFKELARATQSEIATTLVAVLIFSHFFGIIGLAIGVLVGTAGGSLWFMTYLYFKTFTHTTWFNEWCAVYARALISVVIGFTTATFVWHEEKLLLGAPGWAGYSGWRGRAGRESGRRGPFWLCSGRRWQPAAK